MQPEQTFSQKAHALYLVKFTINPSKVLFVFTFIEWKPFEANPDRKTNEISTQVFNENFSSNSQGVDEKFPLTPETAAPNSS